MIQTTLSYRRLAIVLIVAATLFTLTISPSIALPKSIAHQKMWVSGVAMNVVTVDLNDPDVRLSPALACNSIGRCESWSRMINRVRPSAAVTGTFFHTRSFYPTGDILIDGNLVSRGVTGTAITIGWRNDVSFIPLKRGQSRDWSGYQHVLVGGPVLVTDGKMSVYPKDQGFRDGRLFSRRVRTAVGVTKHNKLVMIATTRPVYLSKLAKALVNIGVRDAAALDGGGSTGLYCKGKSYAAPNRSMTNLLVAYDSAVRYEAMKDALTPSSTRMSRAR